MQEIIREEQENEASYLIFVLQLYATASLCKENVGGSGSYGGGWGGMKKDFQDE